MAAGVQPLQHLRHERRWAGRHSAAVGVVDAETAAEIDMRDGDARGLDRFDQIEQPVERVNVRRHLRDLRADVAVDAHHAQPGQLGRVAVSGQGELVRDAEFVAFQTGGDVGVGAGIDIGIHAQAHRGAGAEAHGHVVQAIELALAFDVEAAHARLQRLRHLGARFANAREHDAARVAARGEHARELAARDDVEAAAGLREGLQHGQAGIGLHRITDQVLAAAQSGLVAVQRSQHGAA